MYVSGFLELFRERIGDNPVDEGERVYGDAELANIVTCGVTSYNSDYPVQEIEILTDAGGYSYFSPELTDVDIELLSLYSEMVLAERERFKSSRIGVRRSSPTATVDMTLLPQHWSKILADIKDRIKQIKSGEFHKDALANMGGGIITISSYTGDGDGG